MFLELDKKDLNKIAVIDDNGESLTYGNLCEFAEEFNQVISYRTLVFILANNTLGSLVGYTSFLNNRVVPLLLNAKTDTGLLNSLIQIYQPEYIWLPTDQVPNFEYKVTFSLLEYSLVKTSYSTPKLYDDLSLLLPTSGSTGSPKLVRHSYRNIEANAENVKNLFKLQGNERAMASLPMYYTMGLSVISSHLYAGATVLLCGKSLLDKAFWTLLKEQHATSLTGVPYSFEVLSKLRFFRMKLPDLTVITQGGGKLSVYLWNQIVSYCKETNKRFIATYGQSECTARMAFLPSNLAETKICSIGIAEPGGQLSILHEDGTETIEGEDVGEMVYRGENVTLGYATCLHDLEKSDENHGIMHTGDLARRDSDGCYFIEGRLKRFLKIYGLRISLDEIEQLIKNKYNTDCYCNGTDEKLIVKITDSTIAEEIPHFIEEKIHLFYQNIQVLVVTQIRRNDTGKIIAQ